MKRFITLLLAAILPLVLFAQPSKAADPEPKDIVISSYRVAVKPGQDEAFKAALAAHAQKFHKGSWKWRVGDVQSGPGGNTYQIIEGPFSWTELDSRGDLGAEHTKDYNDNILVHCEKTTPDTYATFQPDLSTVEVTKWSTKVITYHLTVRPGKNALMVDVLKRYKAINAKRGYSVAVWQSAFSGENAYSMAYRTKNGWKDLDDDSPSTRKVADELFGPDGYARLQSDLAAACSSMTSEMVEYKPELSSK